FSVSNRDDLPGRPQGSCLLCTTISSRTTARVVPTIYDDTSIPGVYYRIIGGYEQGLLWGRQVRRQPSARLTARVNPTILRRGHQRGFMRMKRDCWKY